MEHIERIDGLNLLVGAFQMAHQRIGMIDITYAGVKAVPHIRQILGWVLHKLPGNTRLGDGRSTTIPLSWPEALDR